MNKKTGCLGIYPWTPNHEKWSFLSLTSSFTKNSPPVTFHLLPNIQIRQSLTLLAAGGALWLGAFHAVQQLAVRILLGLKSWGTICDGIPSIKFGTNNFELDIVDNIIRCRSKNDFIIYVMIWQPNMISWRFLAMLPNIFVRKKSI